MRGSRNDSHMGMQTEQLSVLLVAIAIGITAFFLLLTCPQTCSAMTNIVFLHAAAMIEFHTAQAYAVSRRKREGPSSRIGQ